MDFNQFDSRAASETGRDLHLAHPATGEPIYNEGKPCIVVVKGLESEAGQAAVAAWRRELMKEDSKEAERKTVRDQMMATAIPLVVGFKNIENGGRPAEAPQDVEWLLNMHIPNGQPGERSFLEQVVDFATKRRNFLGNG
jgi:hypothetical protein